MVLACLPHMRPMHLSRGAAVTGDVCQGLLVHPAQPNMLTVDDPGQSTDSLVPEAAPSSTMVQAMRLPLLAP